MSWSRKKHSLTARTSAKRLLLIGVWTPLRSHPGMTFTKFMKIWANYPRKSIKKTSTFDLPADLPASLDEILWWSACARVRGSHGHCWHPKWRSTPSHPPHQRWHLKGATLTEHQNMVEKPHPASRCVCPKIYHEMQKSKINKQNMKRITTKTLNQWMFRKKKQLTVICSLLLAQLSLYFCCLFSKWTTKPWQLAGTMSKIFIHQLFSARSLSGRSRKERGIVQQLLCAHDALKLHTERISIRYTLCHYITQTWLFRCVSLYIDVQSFHPHHTSHPVDLRFLATSSGCRTFPLLSTGICSAERTAASWMSWSPIGMVDHILIRCLLCVV